MDFSCTYVETKFPQLYFVKLEKSGNSGHPTVDAYSCRTPAPHHSSQQYCGNSAPIYAAALAKTIPYSSLWIVWRLTEIRRTMQGKGIGRAERRQPRRGRPIYRQLLCNTSGQPGGPAQGQQKNVIFLVNCVLLRRRRKILHFLL